METHLFVEVGAQAATVEEGAEGGGKNSASRSMMVPKCDQAMWVKLVESCRLNHAGWRR